MNTVQLQSIGHVPAIPASEVKAGDVRMYNFGSTGLIIKVIELTAKTIRFISFESGKYYISDKRKDSLMPIVKRDQDISEHRPTEANSRKGIVDVSEYFVTELPVNEPEEVTETKEVTIEEQKEQPTKVNVKSISFESESNLINGKIVTTFIDATELMKQVAYSLENGGYCFKTWFTVTFEDDNTYSGRIDILYRDRDKLDLSTHVKSYVELMAGVKVDLNEFEQQHIKMFADEETKAEWLTFYNTYMLEDVTVTVEESIKEETNTNNTVTVTLNEELNGIEITFTDKPDQSTIEQLKLNGFRWSKRGFWYAKQTDNTISFANSLNDSQEPQEAANNDIDTTVNVTDFTYPDIDIDDLDNYTVSDELQRRLHANSMFEVDYKNDCIVTFQQFQQQALQVISLTDNQRIIYYIKKYLQSFKKRYYEQYMKILNHKSANPSWAVTGRGGLNAHRYNKMQDRYDKYIGESVALSKEFERKLGQFKSEIYRDKNNSTREQVNSTDLSNVEFKTVTKEMNIHGYEKKFRMYQYGGYSITKAWGCYRIFDGNGKEIDANLKTTDTLDTAKKYVLMLCKQETA